MSSYFLRLINKPNKVKERVGAEPAIKAGSIPEFPKF